MENLIAIIREYRLQALSQEQLNSFKDKGEYCFCRGDAAIYKNSLYTRNSLLYFIGKIKQHKTLFAAAAFPFTQGAAGEWAGTVNAGAAMAGAVLEGVVVEMDGLHILTAEFTVHNAEVLHKLFPFTAPVSLRSKKTTIGCGDRLGLATPGQIRAIKQYECYPVLAQQSIRELNFTRRTYRDVIADTAFLVFQEGFERGYGADGDHLKSIADIRTALEAGMTMITLDLSEVMQPGAAEWNAETVRSAFEKYDAGEKKRILDAYADKSFPAGDAVIFLSRAQAMLCTVMYKKALDFSLEVDKFLKTERPGGYDLEISIDETTTPTLPEHHFFIIRELHYRKVDVNSLAPRFAGEFQKGIDYIGNTGEFRQQFALHCGIAKANGGYKISVHSGSDKFSVYPVIGACTGMYLHLKTAGTSWLEAVRCLALSKPALYRRLHGMALGYFEQARQFYHITADISRIPAPEDTADAELPAFLDADDSRQLLHITYGGMYLQHGLKEEFYRALAENEELHYQLLEKHIGKHLALLGVPRREIA